MSSPVKTCGWMKNRGRCFSPVRTRYRENTGTQSECLLAMLCSTTPMTIFSIRWTLVNCVAFAGTPALADHVVSTV